LILPEESAGVEAALKRHPKARRYRVAVKGKQILVYEAAGGDMNSTNETVTGAMKAGMEVYEI
jgi:hypothetical protein